MLQLRQGVQEPLAALGAFLTSRTDRTMRTVSRFPPEIGKMNGPSTTQDPPEPLIYEHWSNNCSRLGPCALGDLACVLSTLQGLDVPARLWLTKTTQKATCDFENRIFTTPCSVVLCHCNARSVQGSFKSHPRGNSVLRPFQCYFMLARLALGHTSPP